MHETECNDTRQHYQSSRSTKSKAQTYVPYYYVPIGEQTAEGSERQNLGARIKFLARWGQSL